MQYAWARTTMNSRIGSKYVIGGNTHRLGGVRAKNSFDSVLYSMLARKAWIHHVPLQFPSNDASAHLLTQFSTTHAVEPGTCLAFSRIAHRASSSGRCESTGSR